MKDELRQTRLRSRRMTSTMITMSTIVPMPMYMAWFLLYASQRRWLIPERDLAASKATCSRSA
jgi:hypothetical protein